MDAEIGALQTRLTVLERKLDFLLKELKLEYKDVPLESGEAAAVHVLRSSGDKIEAIKAYRETTGADLLTARNTIERLEKLLR